jgi:hypothetical protein
MRTTERYYTFGDSEIHTISDVENGEYLDTTILIGRSYICTIEGNKIPEFISKLQTIVENYRI